MRILAFLTLFVLAACARDAVATQRGVCDRFYGFTDMADWRRPGVLPVLAENCPRADGHVPALVRQ